MNSYQRLKEKNKSLQLEIIKLLENNEYYFVKCIAHGIKRDIQKTLMFGGQYMIHKPKGKVNMSGLFKKLEYGRTRKKRI